MGLKATLGARRIEAAARAVAERVEQAELVDSPFPHLVIDGLLPRPAFSRLASAIPKQEFFQIDGKTKLDLDLRDDDPYFTAAPEVTQAVWRAARDRIFRETIAPILARRLRQGLEDKYEFLFGREIAQELLEGGLTSTDGRIQGRRPGYDLRPHLDSQHIGVTCLLYFSSSDDGGSGALNLFRPERELEVRDVSTYYPQEQEGISVEIAKTIPIRENLLVAFLNVRNALHGVSVDRDAAASNFVRFAYQCQIVPREFSVTEIYPRLDPEAQARWQRLAEKKTKKTAAPAAQ